MGQSLLGRTAESCRVMSPLPPFLLFYIRGQMESVEPTSLLPEPATSHLDAFLDCKDVPYEYTGGFPSSLFSVHQDLPRLGPSVTSCFPT